jgi:hypothetical protein
MSISPLRQRMIDDMTARHFGEKTQKDYVRCVKNLAAYIGRPPETATAEDLRLYRLHRGYDTPVDQRAKARGHDDGCGKGTRRGFAHSSLGRALERARSRLPPEGLPP